MIDSRLGQQPEMDTQGIELSAALITLRSVDERIKQATDSILRRVEEFCALLASRTQLELAEILEASSSRRHNASASPSRTRHDTCGFQIPSSNTIQGPIFILAQVLIVTRLHNLLN